MFVKDLSKPKHKDKAHRNPFLPLSSQLVMNRSRGIVTFATQVFCLTRQNQLVACCYGVTPLPCSDVHIQAALRVSVAVLP